MGYLDGLAVSVFFGVGISVFLGGEDFSDAFGSREEGAMTEGDGLSLELEISVNEGAAAPCSLDVGR